MHERTGDTLGNALPGELPPSGVQCDANRSVQDDPGQSTSGAGQLPYVAPAVVLRTALEAVAANCYGAPGKADITDCLVGNS